jgi:hypothetical protein
MPLLYVVAAVLAIVASPGDDLAVTILFVVAVLVALVFCHVAIEYAAAALPWSVHYRLRLAATRLGLLDPAGEGGQRASASEPPGTPPRGP